MLSCADKLKISFASPQYHVLEVIRNKSVHGPSGPSGRRLSPIPIA